MSRPPTKQSNVRPGDMLIAIVTFGALFAMILLFL